MKKIISILAVMLTMAAACTAQGTVRNNVPMQRQKIASGVVTNIFVNDTTVNTDTSFLWFSNILGWNVQVQWTITNVTGTTGGTVVYQGSPDNVNWYTVMTDTLQCNSCLATNTVSGLTSGATTLKSAIFKGFPYAYIRVRDITSGTQTSYIAGKITEWSAFSTNLN
jgi:hypothetical protein